MAPSDFEGDVVFHYTFLKEYKTFWVGMETGKIRVSREPLIEEYKSTSDNNNEVAGNQVPSLKNNDSTIKIIDKEGNENTGESEIHQTNHLNNAELNNDDIPQPAQNALTPKDSLEKTEKVSLLQKQYEARQTFFRSQAPSEVPSEVLESLLAFSKTFDPGKTLLHLAPLNLGTLVPY